MAGAGIIMDGALGLKLLKGMTWQNILLHLLVTLIWAIGIQLSTAHPWQTIWKMQRWSVNALIFVLCAFPAFGICVYSGAICLMPEIWRGQERKQHKTEQETTVVPLPEAPQEISPALDLDIQPSTETLHDTTIDTSIQSEYITAPTFVLTAWPETQDLLPTSFSEPQNDIPARVPAEDEPIQDLIDTFPIQQSEPDNEALAVDLLEEYERCAHNNMLDKESQQASLVQARDLLLQLLWHDNHNASLWIKLALTRCELGDLTTALQDALYSLQLQPHTLDYAVLAMSLAFRLHAWDTLVSLVRDEVEQQEELPPSLQSFTECAALQTENA